jgi:hypothetical protein
MKFKKKSNGFAFLVVLSLALFEMSPAQAVSSFNGSVAVTYEIKNILNRTSPGNLSGLDIFGQFELDGSQTVNELEGDGYSSIGHTGFTYEPLSTSTRIFSHTLSLTGNVANGSVYSGALAMFGLEFFNNSTDIFDIAVSFNYSLNINTQGDEASGEVTLDYWNEGSGDDQLIRGYVDLVGLNSDSKEKSLISPIIIEFSLNPGDHQYLLADGSINGTISSVPIPATIWLLGSCLVGLSIFRKSTTNLN